MPHIDQYSFAALPVEMLFNSTHLGVSTAFVWVERDRFFLVTNWHNVSGKDPNTGKHLSPTAAEPNKLKVQFNGKNPLDKKIAKVVSVRDAHGAPLWLVHPVYGNKVDVVALPLEDYPDVEMHPINRMLNANLALKVGMDVFVVGFPFGTAVGDLPIWKRGSIASEPELTPAAQLHIFVDTASRPGMSGSPVIRRSWLHHLMADDSMTFGKIVTRFIGVYSGRTSTRDPLDAQLGFTWPAAFLPEIVSGAKIDCA
jgi:hypothetical protein